MTLLLIVLLGHSVLFLNDIQDLEKMQENHEREMDIMEFEMAKQIKINTIILERCKYGLDIGISNLYYKCVFIGFHPE